MRFYDRMTEKLMQFSPQRIAQSMQEAPETELWQELGILPGSVPPSEMLSEGMTEAGQMQLEMTAGMDAAAQAVENSAAMLTAAANHLMGAGDALLGSAAHLGSLTIPAPAGGGGGIVDGRALAQIVNEANVGLAAAGGIVGVGGGGGGV